MNRALKILLATNSLVLMAGAMLGPIYALFVKKVGGDILNASLAGATFFLAAGLTTLVSGHISDRVFDDKKIISFGYALMGVGFIIYTQVSDIWLLLIAQIVLGFGEAIYSPTFDAQFSRNLDNGKFASQWSLWESTYYFTAAIGAAIGGYIVTTLGFNVMFIAMSSLCFLSSIYLFFLPKNTL